MTKDQVKKVATEKGIAVGSKLKKEEIIRLVQKSEGNDQCFMTGKAATCGQADCLWRPDCK